MIAWLSPDPDSFEPACQRFAHEHYRLTAGATNGADLAVIDLRKRVWSPRVASRLAAFARTSAPEAGIVFIGPIDLAFAERANLRRTAELALVGDDLAPAVEACRQKLRIRNVAEETGERLKSVAALTRLSQFPPIDTSPEPPSVLVAGSPGRDALAAIAAASSVASVCEAALSAGQAMAALETGLYDCAVFLPNGAGDPLLALARAMRRHARLRNVPAIVISDPSLREPPSNCEQMACAHAADDLPSRIQILTRRARLLAAMRRFLSACAGDGVRDRISGAFTPAFFGQHAERIFARSAQTGRVLSLIGVRIAKSPGDSFDAASVRVQTQAAQLVNRVTRAEDCVGRVAQDTFVVMTAATAEADAEIAARRIGGVIANTMFRSRCDRRVFPVATATAVIERRPKERLEEALARVLASLKAATPKAAER